MANNPVIYEVLIKLHFVLDSGDSGRIDYDEKAVLSLLDRTSSHDDAPDEEKDIMANEYLASFKVRRRLRSFTPSVTFSLAVIHKVMLSVSTR